MGENIGFHELQIMKMCISRSSNIENLLLKNLKYCKYGFREVKIFNMWSSRC